MTTTIMMTSDWHLDTRTAGEDRFHELCERVTGMLLTAIEMKVEHFMFLGDFHDPDAVEWWRYQGVLVNLVCKLSENGIRSHWLVGNHDITKSPNYNTLSVIDELRSVLKIPPRLYSQTTCRPYCLKDGLPFNLVALPYPSTGPIVEQVEWRQTFNLMAKNCRHNASTVVISHLQIPGLVPGSESKEFARGSDHQLPLLEIAETLPNPVVFQGHYHRHQEFVKDGVRVMVIGSMARLHFDEENHTPGYVVVRVP